MRDFIIATSPTLPGYRITKTFGLARGNTVRARHLGRDIVAFFRNIVGGEVPEYRKLLAESREQSLDQLVEEARELGANAVISMRMATSMISSGMAEIMAYGTAVWIEPEDNARPER